MKESPDNVAEETTCPNTFSCPKLSLSDHQVQQTPYDENSDRYHPQLSNRYKVAEIAVLHSFSSRDHGRLHSNHSRHIFDDEKLDEDSMNHMQPLN